MKSFKNVFTGRGTLLFLLLIISSLSSQVAFGQGAIGIANKDASPIRLNIARLQLNTPNSQRRPYEWSGAYLRNAFSTSNIQTEVFLMDSSMCGNGKVNGTGFTDHLKVFYTYNEADQLSELLYKHLQLGGNFENYSRKRYQYENGQRSLYNFQIWDQSIQNWEDDYQERFTYDELGRWKGFSSRSYTEDGEWEFVRREQVAYDSNGNLNELIVSDGYENTWVPAQRLEAVFNEDGFYTHIYRQIWMGDVWETITRETATFVEGTSQWRGYLLEEQNSATGEFEPIARELYSYNSRGFWVKTERQEWDNNLQVWQNTTQESYTYTNRGIWIGWLQQIWEDGAWVNNIRQKYVSSSEGRIDLVQEWDAISGDWVNALRNVIKFDDHQNLEGEMGAQTWNDETSSWITSPESRRCSHSWSTSIPTAIERQLPNLNCSIPNPYSLRTPIYCKSLEFGKTYQIDMLDIQGRKVYQAQVRGGRQFSIDRPLPNGIYYLRIQTGGQLTHMQKLLVRP